jgi:uncharacterized protein (TIGR00296 family)
LRIVTSNLKDYLSVEEGRFLVALSREAISKYLSEKKILTPPPDTPANLLQKRGVFVTLTNHASDELRGCIGFPTPTEELAKSTILSAIEAATGDPRFNPVTLDELERDLVVEVSVLTTPEEIRVKPEDLPNHVVVGVDGLIIGRGACRGLLLPQVAPEWGWNSQEFLTNCCLKAGLPPDEWLLKGTEVLKFQAAVFKEIEPKGPVERVHQESHQ